MPEKSSTPAPELPKYKKILEELRTAIAAGQYRVGERLPSESELGSRYGVSRLTVQRALKELQIEGLVGRRAGSGTFVNPRSRPQGYLFGLLIPGLGETEIFEPICQGMAKAGRTGGHALLWGDTAQRGDDWADQAPRLCSDYIERRVNGVFFAPVEWRAGKDALNLRICETLDRAGIPLVLLDRCIHAYPRRSPYDLVGIDNRRAGYRMTEYLIERGSRRPAFLTKPDSAHTVELRIAGFRDAARVHGYNEDLVVRCLPSDGDTISRAVHTLRPDGFVCANDATAAQLMQVLDVLGISVPERVKIAGIDDVRYAKHLRVPLTTLRQPCTALGEVAIQTMLSRIGDRSLPPRDILLECTLVPRRSCGE